MLRPIAGSNSRSTAAESWCSICPPGNTTLRTLGECSNGQRLFLSSFPYRQPCRCFSIHAKPEHDAEVSSIWIGWRMHITAFSSPLHQPVTLNGADLGHEVPPSIALDASSPRFRLVPGFLLCADRARYRARREFHTAAQALPACLSTVGNDNRHRQR